LKVAIHSRTFYDDRLPCFRSVIDELLNRRAEVLLSDQLAAFLKVKGVTYAEVSTFEMGKLPQDIDYAFSVGGDGTLLETVSLVRHAQIPIVGINTGRLGFLATISNDQVAAAVHDIIHGKYTIEYRSLVQVEATEDIFGGLNFGLNEFAITKRDTSSMIIVHTYMNGGYLNTYWADGLIVATATGSTGYSLSVGGPVVAPELNNIFVISPVSPHNLNVRPMVVSNDCELSFKIEGRSKNFLVSLDSRSVSVDESIGLTVKKADFNIGLVKLSDYNFAETLRKKLNWGYDARN